jgi:F-box and leucine-rich repeat protein 14
LTDAGINALAEVQEWDLTGMAHLTAAVVPTLRRAHALVLVGCHQLPLLDITHENSELHKLNINGWPEIPGDALSSLFSLKAISMAGAGSIDLSDATTLKASRSLETLLMPGFTGTLTAAVLEHAVGAKHVDVSGMTTLRDDRLEMLTQVQALDVSGCDNITSAGVGKLTTLRALRMAGCPQDSLGNAALASLAQLTHLDVSGFNRDTLTDTGIGALKSLRSLVVDGCTRLTPALLAHLPALRYLSARDAPAFVAAARDGVLAHAYPRLQVVV